MPHDRADVAEWMERARQDRLAARRLFETGEDFHGVVAFHCQQAVEKALKAFLTLRAEPFEKTHDIGFLLDLCAPLDNEFETIRAVAAPLTDFATAFRYPGPMTPTRRHAETGLTTMERVWSIVLTRMPMGIVVDEDRSGARENV